MKGKDWMGTVPALLLGVFVLAGNSYGAEARRNASAQARPAPQARPVRQMAPRPAPRAIGRPAPQMMPNMPQNRPGPHMMPRPSEQMRVNMPGPAMRNEPWGGRPPHIIQVNAPGAAWGPAGGMRAGAIDTREDLRRKMAVQAGRQDTLRAIEHYRDQRAMFRPMPYASRFSPAAHRALFERMKFVPATYHYRRDIFYAHYHYAPPAYMYRMYPVYGIWDAAFLGFMLEHAMEREYALMYYHHQNEEAMQQWRAELDRMAVENAELRERLAVMDSQVAGLNGTPLDPSYVPEDAQDIALAPEVVEKMGGPSRG